MRAETKLLLDGSEHKRRREGSSEYLASEQLAREAEYENFLILRAEREEAQVRLRHVKFSLLQRAVFLVLAVIIGLAAPAAAVIGALGNPDFLKIAAIGASVFGGLLVLISRLSRQGEAS